MNYFNKESFHHGNDLRYIDSLKLPIFNIMHIGEVKFVRLGVLT